MLKPRPSPNIHGTRPRSDPTQTSPNAIASAITFGQPSVSEIKYFFESNCPRKLYVIADAKLPCQFLHPLALSAIANNIACHHYPTLGQSSDGIEEYVQVLLPGKPAHVQNGERVIGSMSANCAACAIDLLGCHH